MSDKQNARLGHPPDHKGHIDPTAHPHGHDAGGEPPIQGPPGDLPLQSRGGMSLLAIVLIGVAVAALVAVPIALLILRP
ncbi:MAG: hypothetical protein AB7K09_06595 [Planctomycetota bacterium]